MTEITPTDRIEQQTARIGSIDTNETRLSAQTWQDMQSSEKTKTTGGNQTDVATKLGLASSDQLLVKSDRPSEVKRGIDEDDPKEIKSAEQLGKDFESAYQNHLKGKQPNLYSKDLRDSLKAAVQNAYKEGGSTAVKDLSKEINANIPGKDHGITIDTQKTGAIISFVEKNAGRLKQVVPGIFADAYPEQHKTAHDLASTVGRVGIEGREVKKTLRDAFQAEYDKADNHKNGVERMEALAQDVRNRLRGDFVGNNFNTGGSISYRARGLFARQQYIDLDVKTNDK